MTVAIEDPLIAAMTIHHPLPVHESSRRLRQLRPESPRTYGVAVMSDVSRRRWWPLTDAVRADRLKAMFDAALADAPDRPDRAAGRAVTQQLAATLAHVVLGRVVPLLATEGRAWDTGPENLWVHADSEGSVDWVGVVDPTLRALPGDAHFAPDRPARARSRGGIDDGIVELPGEAALATWVAHRSHRALAPLFGTLAGLSGGAMTVPEMWHDLGAAVVGAASQVPLLAGTSEAAGMRRGQAVLDALGALGAPVRRRERRRPGKGLLD